MKISRQLEQRVKSVQYNLEELLGKWVFACQRLDKTDIIGTAENRHQQYIVKNTYTLQKS